MIDFVGKKRYFFVLSAVVILCGIVFAVVAGVPWGIDFTGGTVLTVQFDTPVTHHDVEAEVSKVSKEPLIQESGDKGFVIRMKELTSAQQKDLIESLDKLGNITDSSYDDVSDPVSREKVKGAIWAIVIASGGILLYIAFAFRKVPKPFRYGACAVIALVHDVAVSLAFFAILGHTLNLEVNLMFITGILTVVGYSVNDTIVVFDRIRENLGKGGRLSFETVVNNSLVETVTRSLNTSLTTLIVMVAVFLFVGGAIESFMLVLIVGVISGTYSSIFIASQLLVVWETGSAKRLFKRAA